MITAFDGQLFLSNEKTGIAHLAYQTLLNLPRREGDEYRINAFSVATHPEASEALKKLEEAGYVIKRGGFHNKAYRLISAYIYFSYSMFFGKDPDVNVFFNYIVPPGVKGKSLAYVHDMCYMAYPDTMRLRTRKLLEKELDRSCKRADRIITISELTKSEIMRYLGISEDRIDVVYPGVDSSRFNPYIPKDKVKNTKKKYAIAGDYIIYLGTIEPRKNILRLLKAYARLHEEFTDIPKLVLAGRDGWSYDKIHELADSLELGDDLIFLGYIADNDRAPLLKGAEFFVFPSLYEGFGLPPLEAMACGVPVLVSDTASLPEVVGDAGVMVEPASEDSIYEGMKKLLFDKELSEGLKIKGIEQAGLFSWKRSGEELSKIIYDITQ